jgi:hypothetical protein
LRLTHDCGMFQRLDRAVSQHSKRSTRTMAAQT